MGNRTVPNVQKETSPTGHKWTKEQQDAIYENGTNILVAAAARKW